MSNSPCPTVVQLADFLADRQDAEDHDALAEHVEACAECQRRLGDLAGVADALPGTPCPADLHSSGDSALLANVVRAVGVKAGVTGPRQRIGDYELCDVLGQGGIGVVYRATDVVLRRSVAIKMLRPGHADNAPMHERFLREARAAAALRHDHVVAIHGVSEHAGQPYLVMEYVEGGSLADQLRERGPLSCAEVVQLGIEVASGLVAAHAKGIIHRDVKPGNVLWDAAAGRYKLTDFGLAKALDDVSLTRSGIVVGTPEFLSPEQADGRPVDARSDLFSLGAVLYAAAAGESPFHADSTLATLSRVCTYTPRPLGELRSDFPIELSRLIGRLLEKRAERRPGSASDVVAELRHIAGAATLPADSTRPMRIGRPPGLTRRLAGRRVAAVGLLIAAVAAAGTWYATREVAEPETSPGTSTAIPTGPPKRGFTVVGQPAVFGTLSEAVAAAPADGVVEVYGNERLPISPVRITSKPLVIRAASGQRPILTAAGGQPMAEPAIASDSNLTLTGLHLQWTTSTLASAIKSTGSAALRIERCEIEAGKDTDCLAIFSPLCELRDSRLSARQGKCIGFEPADGAKLSLDNCVLWGRSCLFIPWREPGQQGLPASISVVRNTWQGDKAFHFHLTVSFGSRSPLSIESRRNRFSVDHVLTFFWSHRGKRSIDTPSLADMRRPLTNNIKWQEQENIYAASSRFLSWASPRQFLTPLEGAPTDIAGWEAFWNRPGTGSRQGAAAELRGQVGADEDRVGSAGMVARD
jgi:tRNA A-37 threonylcarbamoyl transferase component Bud32